MTIIKLFISNEKNLNHLNKLLKDPAFIYSILKALGYKECPDNLCLKIGLLKKDIKSVSDSNINDK